MRAHFAWAATGLVALLSSFNAAADSMRRFAVIAGNDRGGEDTRPLLYARDDARKIHDILVRIGGVKSEDARLLLNRNADDLLAALASVERRSQEAQRRGEKTSLLVYYSGHAKEGALRLGDTQLSFEVLKARLSRAPADVRIAVLDSCRSGQMTRTKGVRRAPSFDIETDAVRNARGFVILTSSAADEESQESDQIGGSYFSHHLASGLLGDADQSRDGRVSLSEAYAYAYDRTVADTAESAAGAQHPTFSYELAGNGDIVLTDFANRHEGVHFPTGLPAGTYFLVNASGFVSAEVVKGDEERNIALAPGRYRVKRRMPDRLRIGEILVQGGRLAVLDEHLLKDAAFSDDPVKGAHRLREEPIRYALGLSGGYQSFFDSPTRVGRFPPAPLFGAELHLLHFFRPSWRWSFDVAYGSGRGELKLNLFQFSELALGSSIAVDWQLGILSPYVGARLAMLVLNRAWDNAAYPNQMMTTFSPGLLLGARLHLNPRLAWSFGGRIHYLLNNMEQTAQSLGYWELITVLTYEL